MDKIRNTINIHALMKLNIVKAGLMEDKLGNTVSLNDEGYVVIQGVNEVLSLHKAATLHNFLINNIDKNVDGWRYWYVYVDGERVQLKKLKDLVHHVYVVNVFEKVLASF